MPIRLWFYRQGFGHKAYLDERLRAGLDVRVENPVNDRPVINRLARRVLGVSVGGTPFQRGLPVAGDQEAVRAEVDRDRVHFRQFSDELPTILHVGVVRLVIAGVSPDRSERADLGVSVYADSNRLLRRSKTRRQSN